jgi:hypothetical protein
MPPATAGEDPAEVLTRTGHRASGPWQVLPVMWCVTEFTPDNGPLRVIRGSHRPAHDPAGDMEFPGMGGTRAR